VPWALIEIAPVIAIAVIVAVIKLFRMVSYSW
jgi:hypothetical protein